MNTISLKKTASYSTSDGTTFVDRSSALKHEVYLQRLKNVAAAPFLNQVGSELPNIGTWMVQNADAILSALTVKQRVGRGASKKKAAQ